MKWALDWPPLGLPISSLLLCKPPATIQGSEGSQHPPVPEDLVSATSLRVQEGQSLRLICGTNGNIPARLSWFRGSLALSPSRASDPGVLELPQVVLGDGGEFTCRAQHPWGSCHVSLNLLVQGTACSCSQICGEQQGSWPLVLTLIRGAVMGAGFLLTYGLTWIYYNSYVLKPLTSR